MNEAQNEGATDAETQTSARMTQRTLASVLLQDGMVGFVRKRNPAHGIVHTNDELIIVLDHHVFCRKKNKYTRQRNDF